MSELHLKTRSIYQEHIYNLNGQRDNLQSFVEITLGVETLMRLSFLKRKASSQNTVYWSPRRQNDKDMCSSKWYFI